MAAKRGSAKVVNCILVNSYFLRSLMGTLARETVNRQVEQNVVAMGMCLPAVSRARETNKYC